MGENEHIVEKPAEVWQAEKEKLQAEAAAALADARQKVAESREKEAAARKAEIALEKTEYDYQIEKTDDKYHYVYYFHDNVDNSSVEKCMNTLRAWHRIAPKCDIELWIYSNGGSVIHGMHLFDYIQFLRRNGHKIITGCTGWAASMGGILLQAGDHRVMAKESYILIHEIASGTIGTLSEMEDEVEFCKKIQGRIIDIFAERMTMSRATFRTKWKRKDWWLDSDEAFKWGIVDEIR